MIILFSRLVRVLFLGHLEVMWKHAEYQQNFHESSAATNDYFLCYYKYWHLRRLNQQMFHIFCLKNNYNDDKKKN